MTLEELNNLLARINNRLEAIEKERQEYCHKILLEELEKTPTKGFWGWITCNNKKSGEELITMVKESRDYIFLTSHYRGESINRLNNLKLAAINSFNYNVPLNTRIEELALL